MRPSPPRRQILSGGLLPQNVFLQTTGGATLGTYSTFSGIISSATTVILQTGATLNGRAYSQTAVCPHILCPVHVS